MGDITEKVARSMIADRDDALVRKDARISGLRKEITSLQGELAEAWNHPLTEDEQKAKKALADYESTVRLMEARLKNPLNDLRLYDVVRNACVALDLIRKDRDRHFSALRSVCSAVDEAKNSTKGML